MSSQSFGDKPAGPSVGSPAHLLKSQPGVVRRRNGQVLGMNMILKTDHYPTGRALDLDLLLVGAPNFRAVKGEAEQLGVYGTAQPTVPAVKTLLSILQSSPNSTSHKTVCLSTREEPLLYISGRPYVLRDSSTPLRTLPWAGSAASLEAVEERLKRDVLKEAAAYGGVLLAHEEVEASSERESSGLVGVWLQVDEDSVQTVREVYEGFAAQGWKVEYHRIPISPDRPIEDNYLDAYLSVLKGLDPLTSSVLINCGMGVVRTTFAMTAACIVRRHQFLRLGLSDPFAHTAAGPSSNISRTATPSMSGALSPPATPFGSSLAGTPALGSPPIGTSQTSKLLQSYTQQHALNQSLLALTHLLDSALSSRPNVGRTTASSLLSPRPALLDSLRSAYLGNFQVILSLLGCLEGGRGVKTLVDGVIEACDQVVNLREQVIAYRIKASLELNDAARQAALDKSHQALEKYFFLIAFAAFVEDSDGLQGRFSGWLKARSEIWNQIMFLRKGHRMGSRLFIFAPISDLSTLSRAVGRQVEADGGQIVEFEWVDAVVAQRTGLILRANTLLKSDQWLTQSASSTSGLQGAVGFRQIPRSTLFAVGQPTETAIGKVLQAIKERTPNASTILWLNLREEPLVYVNGRPFCLRQEGLSLRNMKDYSGVTSQRLEALEDRLKSDVVAELVSFEGALLLHSETSTGAVVPVWEDADQASVASVREVMEDAGEAAQNLDLVFKRIPMTSERPPDSSDLREIMRLVINTDWDTTAFVLNDQLGRGRSTVASVIILLTQAWLQKQRSRSETLQRVQTHEEEDAVISGESIVQRSRPTLQHSSTKVARAPSQRQGSRSNAMSWQIINNLLRVIRNGLEVKQAVDTAIDQAGEGINLRDCIEEARARATEEKDLETKEKYVQEGIHHLRRYFGLVLYQAYLEELQLDTFEHLETFDTFVEKRPVFRTFSKELKEGGLDVLAPVSRLAPADGMATTDEVMDVVTRRRGQILSASTILKSDFFFNLQKQSLPERVDGAANFRRAEAAVVSGQGPASSRIVYGTGMPSTEGLRNALIKMGAGRDGKKNVFWTSLREEPVIYISGRPHVLRLESRPLVNVEATGVATEVVEAMEGQLKRDVLAEISKTEGGRLLLHDEVEDEHGNFEIVPIWETVTEADVLTPREVYDQAAADGFKVNYARVAITDEQAPLPTALDILVHRVLSALRSNADMSFNCQMGRGRTTTGMIISSLIASIVDLPSTPSDLFNLPIASGEDSNPYLNGEYRTILTLVSVLPLGKAAKRLADRVIDHCDGVQNLRKAVYDYKLKADAAPDNSVKQNKLLELGFNYLYRYGTLVVMCDYLLESKTILQNAATAKEETDEERSLDFPRWLEEHREITSVLSRKSLD